MAQLESEPSTAYAAESPISLNYGFGEARPLSISADLRGTQLNIPLYLLLEKLGDDINRYPIDSALQVNIEQLLDRQLHCAEPNYMVEFASGPGGQCTFDTQDGELYVNDRYVPLLHREAKIMGRLARRVGRTVSYSFLRDISPSSVTLRTQVYRLRQRLDNALPGLGDPKTGAIETVIDTGLRLLEEWPPS